MINTYRVGFILSGVTAAVVALVGTQPADDAARPVEDVSAPATALCTTDADCAAYDKAHPVLVELPEYTGDNSEHDMLVEVYAARLRQYGFMPVIGCECLVGPATAEKAVRRGLQVDYPDVYADVWWT